MARIPYSRVVNVSLTRQDRFPTKRGFGTQLILTTTAKTGEVDATHRTKLYASVDEVAADWATTDAFYLAALSAFSQNPRPINLKAGYINSAVAVDAAGLQAELDVIWDADQAFYMITLAEVALRDVAMLDGLISWVEARPLMALIDSNDALLESPTDTTNVAARNKGAYERTAVFYHTDSDAYLASAISAYVATRNFDQVNSAYTAKFKYAAGINNVDIGSAALTAVTGFVESLGQSESVGHCANTYIDIGNQNFLVEGSMIKQNVFIDEIHATDWIIARTEEEALALFLNNPRIPFTDVGMQQLASVPRLVMNQAVRAGIVAKDLNPLSGEYEPAVDITVPSAFDVPASQRVARISPVIPITFRYAGAVHYTTINYTMTF